MSSFPFTARKIYCSFCGPHKSGFGEGQKKPVHLVHVLFCCCSFQSNSGVIYWTISPANQKISIDARPVKCYWKEGGKNRFFFCLKENCFLGFSAYFSFFTGHLSSIFIKRVHWAWHIGEKIFLPQTSCQISKKREDLYNFSFTIHQSSKLLASSAQSLDRIENLLRIVTLHLEMCVYSCPDILLC